MYNTIKHITRYIKGNFIFCKRESSSLEVDRVIYYDNIKHLTQTDDNLYHDKIPYNMTYPRSHYIRSSASNKPKIFRKNRQRNIFTLLNSNYHYKLSNLIVNSDKNISCLKQTNYLFDK